MKYKVLVVDDSGFFRRRVSDILNADPRFEVICVAKDGQDAIAKTAEYNPDVITMDYEMPVMDGVTAVRHIMASTPTPILMFSSLTYEGARVTLNALEAGAVDFLSKQFDAIAASESEQHRLLADRVFEVASSRRVNRRAGVNTHIHKPLVVNNSATAIETSASPVSRRSHLKDATTTSPAKIRRTARMSVSPDIVIIGTSTGGPAALQTLFKQMPEGFNKPIVIIQHMPASFTKAFAERLNKLTSLQVSEAQDGDRLRPGHVYIAPGGRQLMLTAKEGGRLHILDGDERVSYRPSVDIALASAAKHYGAKALAIIMTGMGSDGKEGAQLLKHAGGSVWAQDEASCVIFGMPMAVIKAGLVDDVLPLNKIGDAIFSEAG